MVVTGAFRQQAELRRHRRQSLLYPAWIVIAPEQRPIQCVLSDVSKSGARIALGSDDDMPEMFTLYLSADGKSQRSCRVVWREPRRLGVEFL